MERPIEWHEKRLEWGRKYAEKLIIKSKALQNEIDELLSDCEFLEYQITEAKKANKPGLLFGGFNLERFRVKKTK